MVSGSPRAYLLFSGRRTATAVHIFDGVLNTAFPEVAHVEELLLLRLLPAHSHRGGGVHLVELVARGDVVVSLFDERRRRRAGTEDALAADVIQGKVGQDEFGGRELISSTFNNETGLDQIDILGNSSLSSIISSHAMSHDS